MKKYLKLALLSASVCLLSATAHAHRAWLLPSATVLSGNDTWVTVDAAISNDLFYFEHHPLQLDNLSVLGPDGKTVTPENQAKGRYRSTFDVKLAEPGTYKVMVVNQGAFARYKLDGQNKRWRGKAEEVANAIPANASDVKISEIVGRIESFITSGKPTTETLKPTGVGLELVPVTHPNNLVVGEKATFKLVLDGKPAAGLDVQVVPGGIRYRDKLNDTTVKTDDTGAFSVTWKEPGYYWLSASTEDDKSKIKDAKRRSSYAVTVEVMPE